MNPFQVVKDFEQALAEYTGAPYVVTTTSCTMALLLAVAWHLRTTEMLKTSGMRVLSRRVTEGRHGAERLEIEIPKRTYVGVPMSIIHAGGRPTFRDEKWLGRYQLKPLPIWDSARWLTSGMYFGKIFFDMGSMVCLSFHWAKILGIQQGGAILHDNAEADTWLRRARFDGREEGVHPKDQKAWQLGYHAYMSPEIAAEGLMRLALLPRHNEPLPTDDYPDLSTFDLFK